MNSADLWRAVAIVSTIGWAATGWYATRSPATIATTAAHAPAPGAPAASERPRRRTVITRVVSEPDRTSRDSGSSGSRDERSVLSIDAPSDEAIARARALIEQEQQQRHADHMSERTQEALDILDEFAEEHGLSDSQYADLSEAVVVLHESLAELGPPGGPGGPGGGPPEEGGGPREAFDAFDTVLNASLSEGQAEDLREALRPGPPRG